jgi:HAD superfamily hydrolase (TIGR01484 family)
MPERLYLFDVDGTLTEPRQHIDPEIEEIIMEWILSGDKKVYLVTGSDVSKTSEQLGEDFMDACLGVFTCSGNVFRQNDQIIYSNVFDPSDEFITDLELYLDNSQWRSKKGNHIERRPGMINFSTVGRNANKNMRQAYARWDKTSLEREDIVAYIKESYPELEVSIGGSISVDIYPKGKNKGQVVEKLRELHGDDVEMIFVGDKNIPGGNDWPLAQRLETIEGSHWYQVLCPEETRSLIEYGELFI